MRIVVYGASGYQGKLVAAELRRRDLDVVLAGRSAERLRAAATGIGMPDADVQVAGSSDAEALVAAFRGADAVINCAGPFTVSGDTVVQAAIAARSHYVDTCGEQPFIKHLYDTYAADAMQSGVTVVPAATDGGVPGDLIAHLLAANLEPVDELTSAHLIVGGGGPSRGSLRSALETLDTLRDGGLTYLDGDWQVGIPLSRDAVTFPGSDAPTLVARFPLQEVVSVPRHVRVRRVQSVAEAGLAARLSTPLSPELIDSLPEGPSSSDRQAQRFTIVIDAVSADGGAGRGVVQGTDTYGTTAVIAAEAAHRLVSDKAPSGVVAPAQAFEPAGFLDTLAAAGVSWSIENFHASPALHEE
jgi:short subunit dehydrogenase-like uncharacterized protein